MTVETQSVGSAPLRVDNLSIEAVRPDRGRVQLLQSVSFEVRRGEILGLVGETGSGKSITARAILGVLPPSLHVVGGEITHDGVVLTAGRRGTLSERRGKAFAFVPQDLRGALHPTLTIGKQFRLLLARNRKMGKAEALEVAHQCLEDCGIAGIDRVLVSYPHELSGGMAQRVTIALAMALDPEVLIADEPTTACDVTVQKQILDILSARVGDRGTAILLITHDLGLVGRYCGRVAVMKSGEIVESGPTSEVLERPQAEYTKMLVEAARTSVVGASSAVADDALLQLAGVVKTYEKGPELIKALKGVSLTVQAGESVGIVGESGSGKSTLLRIALGLETPDAGTVRLFGQEVGALDPTERRALRGSVGVVFQEPREQLDPRWSVARILAEPRAVMGDDAPSEDEMAARLEMVNLRGDFLNRKPDTLSGGQAQRVAIARALTRDPKLLFLDEPTASLDMSTRAQILELFAALKNELGLTLVYVSHDLDSVRAVTDRVVVMRAGEIFEEGPTSSILANPTHPYTQRLLAAEMRLARMASSA